MSNLRAIPTCGKRTTLDARGDWEVWMMEEENVEEEDNNYTL